MLWSPDTLHVGDNGARGHFGLREFALSGEFHGLPVTITEFYMLFRPRALASGHQADDEQEQDATRNGGNDFVSHGAATLPKPAPPDKRGDGTQHSIWKAGNQEGEAGPFPEFLISKFAISPVRAGGQPFHQDSKRAGQGRCPAWRRGRRFTPCRCCWPRGRRCRSSWCGRIRRGACPRARKCARRSSRAGPGAGWRAGARCGGRRRRPGRC